MLLWLVLSVLTAAALAYVLRPLFRAPAQAAPDSAADLAVYKDQLAEIEAERERGLISEAEAEAARIEVSRRLLASSEASPEAAGRADIKAGAVASRTFRSRVGIASAAAVVFASLVTYLAVGMPELPSSPLGATARMPLDRQQIGELVGKVEERLRAHPEDGEGWDVLAPVYLKLERYRDAADAYAKAIRIKGESVQRLMGLAEASVMSNNGIITEEARKAFERVVAHDPKRPDARFWLAIAREQDGDVTAAVAEYRKLLAEAPPEADWRQLVEDRLHIAEKSAVPGDKALEQAIAKVPPPAAGAAPPAGRPATPPPAKTQAQSPSGRPERGPSAEDMAAAQQMSPEDRQKMIQGMVDGLAQRLKASPKDLRGWLMLARSYANIGREAEAKAALAEARKHFAGEEPALTEINALARSLGL